MRLRNKPWAADVLAACPYYIRDSFSRKGGWAAEFGSDRPIHLEIGCGKGLYIAGTAPRDREVNYIGADIKGLVIAYGIRATDAAYGGADRVGNVRFLQLDAERIGDAFDKTDNVRRIIINFCNPWSKPHHHKRRLTHPRQLLQYREFLADDGEILFKTDDDDLFQASLEYFPEAGFEMTEVQEDYYAVYSPDEASLTEHERKFMEMGLPIHFIRAKKTTE